MTTFIDTNILIHLTDRKSYLNTWAVSSITSLKKRGYTIISDIVYCEFSIGMQSKEDVDVVISTFGLERIRSSDAALFKAGEAFKKYKRDNAGPKTGVLPDFIIGATAVIMQAPLLTSNPKDFVNYFPDLKLIHPEC